MSSSKNVLTITDNSGAITGMSYVNASVIFPQGENPDNATPYVQQSGKVFTVTFNCNRKSSSSVADSFNKASGGAGYEYAAYGSAATPDDLHFWFKLTINFRTFNGSGTATLNIGQGRSGVHNNWWLGGSVVNSSRPNLALPYTTTSAAIDQLNIPVTGGVSDYTFWAGTVTPYCPIRHFFVLMLENHSFDNMFAMSNIPNITAANQSNSNSYNNQSYPVKTPAPVNMPTDPGHEFADVVTQLCGQGTQYHSGQPYPPINNSGFAYNYATSTTEKTGRPRNSNQIGDIMACFDTASQLPVLYTLATQFALCDHWFSSLPGPTWPNRYFLHGASSNGLDDSPTSHQIDKWESVDGFSYPHGSIFDALKNENIPYRIYADIANSFADDPSLESDIAGAFPQVCSLKHINFSEVYYLKYAGTETDSFAKALHGGYTAQYTFIEPNYGDVVHNTFIGGSSQHPMDGVSSGEALIKYVYESIRNSPLWDTSMLIITYDEHGGFYDSVAPWSAIPPYDSISQYGQSSSELSVNGFDFSTFGVRVPAVVISPWVSAGVNSKTYDHSSVLATLEAAFGFGPLTIRDANATNLLGLLTTKKRTDCPHHLPDPPQRQPSEVKAASRMPFNPDEPLPDRGPLTGALYIALKTEISMSDGTDEEKKLLFEKFKLIKNRGQADAYLTSVLQRANAKRLSDAASRQE